jgi:hypothetical protein
MAASFLLVGWLIERCRAAIGKRRETRIGMDGTAASLLISFPETNR